MVPPFNPSLADNKLALNAGWDEKVPEAPVNPVSRPGDLWQIGPHRLICGDCRGIIVVLKLLDDARPTVCITSPPCPRPSQPAF